MVCSSPKVTYLNTKIEGGFIFFISNFALLSWRIALKNKSTASDMERDKKPPNT